MSKEEDALTQGIERLIADGVHTIAGVSVDIQIMVYNHPATSGIDVAPRHIARLVRKIDSVTMGKESTGDIQGMHALDCLAEFGILRSHFSRPKRSPARTQHFSACNIRHLSSRTRGTQKIQIRGPAS